MPKRAVNIVLAIAALSSASAYSVPCPRDPSCDQILYELENAKMDRDATQQVVDYAQAQYDAAKDAYDHCSVNCDGLYHDYILAGDYLHASQGDLAYANDHVVGLEEDAKAHNC